MDAPGGNFFTDRVLPYLGELVGKAFGLIKSRKFVAAVGGTLTLLAQPNADPSNVINGIAGIWAAFILATAYEDAHR